MSGVCCGSVGSGGGLDQTPPLCRPVPLEGTGAGLEERSSGGLCPSEGNAGIAAWESLHWGTGWGEMLIFFQAEFIEASE